jgi:hypothetical protein
MQAAFALAKIDKQTDIYTIHLCDFIKLTETDYEHHTSASMSFYSKVLLDILHKTSFQDKTSMIYMHSHKSANIYEFENDDHKMIFRISYAYMPFGIHASLYYTNNEITGKIWLPMLSTTPLNIINEYVN